MENQIGPNLLQIGSITKIPESLHKTLYKKHSTEKNCYQKVEIPDLKLYRTCIHLDIDSHNRLPGLQTIKKISCMNIVTIYDIVYVQDHKLGKGTLYIYYEYLENMLTQTEEESSNIWEEQEVTKLLTHCLEAIKRVNEEQLSFSVITRENIFKVRDSKTKKILYKLKYSPLKNENYELTSLKLSQKDFHQIMSQSHSKSEIYSLATAIRQLIAPKIKDNCQFQEFLTKNYSPELADIFFQMFSEDTELSAKDLQEILQDLIMLGKVKGPNLLMESVPAFSQKQLIASIDGLPYQNDFKLVQTYSLVEEGASNQIPLFLQTLYNSILKQTVIIVCYSNGRLQGYSYTEINSTFELVFEENVNDYHSKSSKVNYLTSDIQNFYVMTHNEKNYILILFDTGIFMLFQVKNESGRLRLAIEYIPKENMQSSLLCAILHQDIILIGSESEGIFQYNIITQHISVKKFKQPCSSLNLLGNVIYVGTLCKLCELTDSQPYLKDVYEPINRDFDYLWIGSVNLLKYISNGLFIVTGQGFINIVRKKDDKFELFEDFPLKKMTGIKKVIALNKEKVVVVGQCNSARLININSKTEKWFGGEASKLYFDAVDWISDDKKENIVTVDENFNLNYFKSE